MTNEVKTAKTITLYQDDLVNAVRTQNINGFVTDCTEEFLDKFSSKDKGLLVMGVVMGQNNMVYWFNSFIFKLIFSFILKLVYIRLGLCHSINTDFNN